MIATQEPPAFNPDLLEEARELNRALKLQSRHKFFADVVLQVDRNRGLTGWRMSTEPVSMTRPATLDTIREIAALNERRKILSELDRFQYGVRFPVWHDALFNLAELRVRNPGVPIHFLVTGSNGSAKSEFAAMCIARVLNDTKRKPVICLASDEPISKQIQQAKLYRWLPVFYQNERGRTSTNAYRKMGYSGPSGFTENQFSLDSGSTCVFRFWSAPATLMEGTRPWTTWGDEAMPIEFLDAVDRRLITEAENSIAMVDDWKRLLDEREKRPEMEFPKEKIADVMCGVGMLTWTPINGVTDVVTRFQEGGTVLRTMEADPELLPRRDSTGKVLGGEIMPTLIRGRDGRYLTQFFHASENLMGGNWDAMKRVAIESRHSKTRIRWQCYGKVERQGGSPFSNFNPQVHVRPRHGWIPKVGTYYMAIDPVVQGGKCWTMLIVKVAAEQQGYIAPGDIVVVHEYPQTNDYIPGVGFPDEWCQPGGKGGVGIAGNIQHAISGGFEFKAAEIRRLWQKIGEWECEENKDRKPGPIEVPFGNLIMDSRAANTEKENETESKTLIQWMEDLDIHCVPAGRGSGAQVGEGFVAPGEQMINNALAYDVDNCVLDEKTGFMVISPLKGKGPKLWILEHCTNLIMALQNYPGIQNGGRSHMTKDLIDPLRYIIIADPKHYDPHGSVSYVT